MSRNSEQIHELAWYIAELCWWARGADERMSEFSDEIVAVNTQLDKVATEESGLVKQVSDLEAALAAAQVEDPAVTSAFADLKTKVQALDDLVPDAAPAAPAEPVAEQAPEAPADPAPTA